jgi:hypothetical protein
MDSCERTVQDVTGGGKEASSGDWLGGFMKRRKVFPREHIVITRLTIHFRGDRQGKENKGSTQ